MATNLDMGLITEDKQGREILGNFEQRDTIESAKGAGIEELVLGTSMGFVPGRRFLTLNEDTRVFLDFDCETQELKRLTIFDDCLLKGVVVTPASTPSLNPEVATSLIHTLGNNEGARIIDTVESKLCEMPDAALKIHRADISSIVKRCTNFVDRRADVSLDTILSFYQQVAGEIKELPPTILHLAMPHLDKLAEFKIRTAAMQGLGEERGAYCCENLLSEKSSRVFRSLANSGAITLPQFEMICKAIADLKRLPSAETILELIKAGRELFSTCRTSDAEIERFSAASDMLFADLLQRGDLELLLFEYTESSYEADWKAYLGSNFRGLSSTSAELLAGKLGSRWKEIDPLRLPALLEFLPAAREELLLRGLIAGASKWAAQAVAQISYSVKRGAEPPISPNAVLSVARTGQVAQVIGCANNLSLSPDTQSKLLTLVPSSEGVELYALSGFDQTVLERHRKTDPRIAFILDTGSSDPELYRAYIKLGLERFEGDKAKVALALMRAGHRTEVAKYLGVNNRDPEKNTEPLHGRTWRAVAVAFSRGRFGGGSEGLLSGEELVRLCNRIDLSLKDWRIIAKNQANPKVIGQPLFKILTEFPAGVIDSLEDKYHLGAFQRLEGKPRVDLYKKYIEHELWRIDSGPMVYQRLVELGMAVDVAYALGVGRYSKEQPVNLSSKEWSAIPLLMVRAGIPEILNNLERFTLDTEQLAELVLACLCWPRRNVIPNEQAPEVRKEREFRQPFFENIKHFPRAVLETVDSEVGICKFLDIVKLPDWELYNEFTWHEPKITANSTITSLEFYRKLAKSQKSLLERCCRTYKNVPGELILELLNIGSETAINYLENGELDRRQWRTVVDILIKRGEINHIIKEGRTLIPEHALEAHESEWHFLEYREKLGLSSPSVFHEYLDRRRRLGELSAAAFCAEIKGQLSAVLSSGAVSPTVLHSPYYKELIAHVYPGHAGHWSNFAAAHRAPDRSDDLKGFKLRERYILDLSEGVRMVLKEGEAADETRYADIIASAKEVSERFRELRWNAEKVNGLLDQMICDALPNCPPNLHVREERLMMLILEEFVRGEFSEQLKRIIIAYHLANTPNAEEHMEGTRDRSLQAKNPRYAQLVTLHEFFGDTIKDTINQINLKASRGGRLDSHLARYYKQLSATQSTASRNEVLARSRADSLGITSALLERLAQVAENTSGQKRRDALQNIVSGQQRQIARVIKNTSGAVIDPDQIHLATFSIENFLTASEENKEGVVEQAQLKALGEGSCEKIFAAELQFLRVEIGKYRPETSPERKALQLEGRFLKNKPSAHARGTAGVCVAGDNPAASDSRYDTCQWNQENFFQFVIFDPHLLRCEGALLLHHYMDQGRKVLTISFNPTNSLLYRTEERQLFDSLLKQLVIFADENGFDLIATSSKAQIRTNRTATDFEKRLDAVIAERGKKITLSEPKSFSFKPEYIQQEFDVLWERP